MNVNKIASKITIRPTNKKMKQAKQFIENSGLPREMPVEKKIYYSSEADCFDKIKDSIQISIENMKRKS